MKDPHDMSDEEREAWQEQRQQYTAVLERLDRLAVAFREAVYSLDLADGALIRDWPPEGRGPDRLEIPGFGLPTALADLKRVMADCRGRLDSAGQETRAAARLVRERAYEEVGLWGLGPSEDWPAIEEAIDVVLTASRKAQQGHDDWTRQAESWRDRLLDIGMVLQKEVRALYRGVEREKARNAQMKQLKLEPAPLRDGRDSGGRRHYLMGEPVHAGDRIMLLTRWGWLPGRFESGGDGAPRFYASPIPGDADEVSWAITEAMHFARPPRE
jgi:hypothetical protein